MNTSAAVARQKPNAGGTGLFLFVCFTTGLLPFFILSLSFQSPAHAATASRVGGSGMSWMRTADILDPGELVLYDQLGIDNYVILNTNLNDYDTFNNLGFNYGLFKPLEVGIQAAYLANDQHKTSAIRSYKGIIKLRLLGNEDKDPYAVSISTYKTSSPADIADKVGSGETENGTEINAGYYSKDFNLHLTLGSATADAKYYNPDVVYFSVDKQYANIGMEFKVAERFVFGIEGIQEQSDNPLFDKNQIFAFSLQYKAGRHWRFDYGASFGVPEDRSEPSKSFYIGVNYRLAPDRRSPPVTTPIARPAPRPAISVRPPPQSTPRPPPARDTTPKQGPRKAIKTASKFTVKIQNATGSNAAVHRVAAYLKRNGYQIASIQRVTHQSKTEIRYPPQLAKQALRLAVKLPGNQNLRKTSRLEKGVDFEIIVGSDIVGSIR